MPVLRVPLRRPHGGARRAEDHETRERMHPVGSEVSGRSPPERTDPQFSDKKSNGQCQENCQFSMLLKNFRNHFHKMKNVVA